MQDHQGTRDRITVVPIGTIHTPFTDPAGMPIQPSGAAGVQGSIIMDPDFQAGLTDLAGFSRIILLYLFHRSQGYSLSVTPFLDTKPHGVFATRAPRRPNPLGFSIVRLMAVNGNELIIGDADILDGTPLLDLKPYIPAFDSYPEATAGWLDNGHDAVAGARSDRRFCEKSGDRVEDR